LPRSRVGPRRIAGKKTKTYLGRVLGEKEMKREGHLLEGPPGRPVEENKGGRKSCRPHTGKIACGRREVREEERKREHPCRLDKIKKSGEKVTKAEQCWQHLLRGEKVKKE